MLGMAMPAFANDGIAAVGLGGLILAKTDDIAMKKEVLNVGWQQISIDYEFLNESSSDKEETITFPLPEYPVFDPYNLSYFGQPDAFSIAVDGQSVPYKTIVQVFEPGRAGKRFNITKELEDLGLSKEQMLDPNLLIQNRSKKAKAQIKALVDKGYLELDAQECQANWTVEVNYQWKQVFPAGRVLHVHHQYRPFSSAYLGFNDRKQLKDVNFCQDKSFTDSWERKLKQAEEAKTSVEGTYVSYILKTGNTWKNGIEDFTLNLRKGSSQEMVTLCFPSDFTRIDDKTLQTHITNFHPTNDLNVYFANIKADDFDSSFHGTIPKIKY